MRANATAIAAAQLKRNPLDCLRRLGWRRTRPMLDDWPVRLSQRSSTVRLDGIEVFYDFDWREVIGHDRSAFRNGQALTRYVTSECPEHLTPTLVLTCLDDQQPRSTVSNDRFVVVVPIHEYQAQSGADPAATFFNRLAKAPITDLTRLAQLSSDEVDGLLDLHLDKDGLEAWLGRSDQNRSALVEMVSAKPELLADLASARPPLHRQVGALDALDDDLVAAFLDYLARVGWPDEAQRAALSAVSRSPCGSKALGEALTDHLPARLQETRADAARYRDIIEDPGTTETRVQEFIERRPWLVGLEYHRVRGRLPVLRGETDFILDRFDGYYDVLELKSPNHAIVEEASQSRRGQPASPSQYRLSPQLGLALAQAHFYRYALSTMSPESAELYGLPHHRHPVVTILIGRAADLSVAGRHLLKEFNLSLSRVQIIPFDQLADRIEGMVSNLETLLTRPTQEAV